MKTKHILDSWKWVETDDVFLAWNPTEKVNDLLPLILKFCESLETFKSSDETKKEILEE